VIGSILFFLVSNHLALGMLATLLAVPQRTLGERFFRFNATVSLCLLVLGRIVYTLYGSRAGPQPAPRLVALQLEIDQAGPWLWVAGALALGYLLSLPFGRPLVTRALLGGATLAGAAFLALVSSRVAKSPLPEAPVPLVFPLDFLLSALALGSVVVCMILGHWYLVEPGMSVRPLRRVAALFIVVLVARAVVCGYTSLVAWQGLRGSGEDLLTGAAALDLLFFGQRVIFGLALPLALSWMIWQTVKIRSTQSATGILYVAVVFILFGEFLSHYMLVSTGYPL